MREALARNERDLIVDDEERPSAAASLITQLLRRPGESAGIGVLAAASVAIIVNAVAMQNATHPAPMFAREVARAEAPRAVPVRRETPPLPPEPIGRAEATGSTPAQATDTLVLDIQTALARRGFDVGEADGLMGPKTSAAIRAFQEERGLEPTGEPSARLLALLERRADARPAPVPASADPDLAPEDPIAALIDTAVPEAAPAPAPVRANARLAAVQRALADLGYGQVDDSGLIDESTRRAIRSFETEHALPVTGELSPRLVREIERVQGAPLR